MCRIKQKAQILEWQSYQTIQQCTVECAMQNMKDTAYCETLTYTNGTLSVDTLNKIGHQKIKKYNLGV